jgi:hypothetical protein
MPRRYVTYLESYKALQWLTSLARVRVNRLSAGLLVLACTELGGVPRVRASSLFKRRTGGYTLEARNSRSASAHAALKKPPFQPDTLGLDIGRHYGPRGEDPRTRS